MMKDFLILGGYGHFVWPAFMFAFAAYFSLYLKTSKELRLHEKKFLIKFEQSPIEKIKVLRYKATSKAVLSDSSIR